jgi:PIN domain nuclease of toxin-antitoxin system
MRLLLDSHTLIWVVDKPTRLPERAQELILDHANDRLVSAAT